MQVPDITCHDDGPFASCDENDRRVDDVGRACAATQDPRCLGEYFVERRNDCGRSLRKRAEWRLARGPTPGLSEHACGDHQARARLKGLANERTHSRVAPLERDEGAGV
jgi:hypothetical protein